MATSNKLQDRLRETAVVGLGTAGATVINLVKVKVIAILVGVEGAGLISQLSSILSTVSGTVTFGTGQSGIQRIAVASTNSVDGGRVSLVFRTLQFLAIAMGLVGAIVVIVFSRPLAAWALGDADQYLLVAFLAPGIFIATCTAPLNCLIEGLQRMSLVSRASVFRSLFGLMAAVLALGLAGVGGVLSYVLLSALAAFVVAKWLARDCMPKRFEVNVSEVKHESKKVLGLGGAIAVSGLILSWSQFAERGILVGSVGVDAIGLIACSTALCDLVANLIWASSGTSFFPRVSQLRGDDQAIRAALSTQVELLCLLLLPVTILLVLLGDILIFTVYSRDFEAAQGVLRFQAIGLIGYCIHTPMRILIGGLELRRALLFLSLASVLTRLGSVLVLVPIYGVEGYGMSVAISSLAAAAMYLFYAKMSGVAGIRPSLVGILGVSALILSILVLAQASFAILVPAQIRYIVACTTVFVAISIGWKRFNIHWSDVRSILNRLVRGRRV
ncbi:oligosaccharide flippase family protein [bacterium]|nr:oligosaccharide flippase family protein [bacterium]MDB4724566.1 oligosaccharide flippase family protein [Planctomycetota bacterium]